MSQEPFLQKLTLRNFRSIRNEAVTFTNPLFLVGRNGSGKSNFVDALAFISECMTTPLHSVIEQWGGLGRICHIQTPLDAPSVYFRLDYQLGAKQEQQGAYAFALRITPQRNFVVALEYCNLDRAGENSVWFNRAENAFTTSISGIQPVLSPQALAMPLLGGVQDLSAIYQSLAAMRLYHIKPEQVSSIQGQTNATTLRADGSNITSVLLHLSKLKNRGFSRVGELLQSIVPGISPLEPVFSNGQSVLFFEQEWPNSKAVLEASAMSNGTLSTLGLISIALQEPAPSLVAIEEPELNIHPGALEVISDVINIAAQRTQVVVTTHSPDLLDAKWIRPENLRVVEWKEGATHISELGNASVTALRQHLMGAGELLRANALDAAAPAAEVTSDLFQETSA